MRKSERKKGNPKLFTFTIDALRFTIIFYSTLNFSYPKAEHLKSRKSIEQLFKSGQSFFIYPYKVVYQFISQEVRKPESPKEEQANNLTPSPSTLITSGLSNSRTSGLPNFPTPGLSNSRTSGLSDLPTSGLPVFPTCQLLSGFAVSTKNFKRAVDRNRIKRLGREAFRLNKQTLTDQLAANHQQLQVFFIFTDKKLPDYKLIEPKMQACLKKLGWLARQTP